MGGDLLCRNSNFFFFVHTSSLVTGQQRAASLSRGRPVSAPNVARRFASSFAAETPTPALFAGDIIGDSPRCLLSPRNLRSAGEANFSFGWFDGAEPHRGGDRSRRGPARRETKVRFLADSVYIPRRLGFAKTRQQILMFVDLRRWHRRYRTHCPLPTYGFLVSLCALGFETEPSAFIIRQCTHVV